jgi:spermidine synthase
MTLSNHNIVLEPSIRHHELIKDGWFFESETMWPGQKFGIKVGKFLINGKSAFQDILVFESSTYGNVLVLDGVIQATERDEFAYQEMISHTPLFAHKNPKKVLIIGGGDGGVLREVAKHKCVTEIHMCEIDQQVVEVSKQFFSNTLATSFDDPRLKLMFCDATKYLLEEGDGQNYDVIICDSSDPVGPAKDLFGQDFFTSMYNALSPDGILCTQCECQWLHLDLISTVLQHTKKIFGNENDTVSRAVKYAYTTIPSYPCGQIGFIVASKCSDNNVSIPSRNVPESMKLQLKYYSNKIHKAAFVLPVFSSEVLVCK